MRTTWLKVLTFITFTSNISGNFPLLDVDTNMRIVLVPSDMPVGIAFYRIKATDSDHNFPLSFDVLGSVGSALITLEFIGCSEIDSICQANVVLKKTLDLGRTYEFQLRVTDTTGDFTRVKAAISATQGTAYVPSLLGPKSITIPENSPVGFKLTTFIVRKNELNSRMVFLEIQEPEGRIELRQRLLSNNRTEGTLLLKKKLDFETEPWFTFQLLALNGHTNTTVDTRNVLVSEVVVGVEDVQDTPPIFTLFNPYVQITQSFRKGDILTRVTAEDGDKRNKRLIRYGFLADANPFVGFFDLDDMSGEIRLKRNFSEILETVGPNEHMVLTVMAEEIVPAGETQSNSLSRYRRSGQKSTRTLRNITFWIHSLPSPMNITSYLTFSSTKYVGEIEENSLIGTLVRFSLKTNVVSDSDVKLTLESIAIGTNQGSPGHLPFDLIPSEGHANFTFELRVIRPDLLDYEKRPLLKFQLLATSSSSLNSSAELEIYIRDENDCKPEFENKTYNLKLPENSLPGTTLVQIHATDCDTAGNYGRITYAKMEGGEAFHLNPVTGQITVNNPTLLDREFQSEIRFYVTATDGDTNPNIIVSTRNTAVALVTVTVQDVNDVRPKFLSDSYQVVLTPDLTQLKRPFHVTATDGDSAGTRNAQVQYEVVNSTYFTIDSITGNLNVISRPVPNSDSGIYLGAITIRAYDLGSPRLSTETTVDVFSEDVFSQDIRFLFPTSPEVIRKDKKNIEEMLSILVKGHALIQKIDLYEEQKVKPVLRSLKYAEKRDAEDDAHTVVTELEQQKKATEKTVVTTRVNVPLDGTNRVFDLEALKGYMIIEERQVTMTTTSAPPEVVKAESQNLFWLLVSLIVLLLILFLIFLICIFCPCCWYNRSSKRKSSKIKTESVQRSRRGTDREFEVVEDNVSLVPARSKQVQTVMDSDDYKLSLTRFPRAREAWSGDDERLTHGRDRTRLRIDTENQARPTVALSDRVDIEDWEVPSKFYRRQDDEFVTRWRFGDQLSGRNFPGRNRVGDVNGVRHHSRHIGRTEGYLSDRGSDHGGIYERQALTERRLRLQYSPPLSLPPEPPSADYRIHSERKPAPRFFRTDRGEVLQLDVDGNDGKEMLMRRFIYDQNTRENGLAVTEESRVQQRAQHQHNQTDRNDSRPKAAATNSRRQVQAGREIPALIEEDEPSRLEGESSKPHRKEKSKHRSHNTKTKDRSRSRESEDELVKPTSHKTKGKERSRSRESEDEKSKNLSQRTKVKNRSKSRETEDEVLNTHDHKAKTKDRSRSRKTQDELLISQNSKTKTTIDRSRSRETEDELLNTHDHKANTKNRSRSRKTQDELLISQNSKTKTTIDRSRSRETEDELLNHLAPKIKMKDRPRAEAEQPQHRSHTKIKDRSTSREPDEDLVDSLDESDEDRYRSKQSLNPHLLVVKSGSSRENRDRKNRETELERSLTTKPLPIVISKEIEMEEETMRGQIIDTGSTTDVGHLLLPEDLDRLLREEDEDSGIGLVGMAMAQRNKMLEKKSVFTIAYDEMATQNVLRPDTAFNNNGT